MKEITITVTGKAGSGKTKTALKIFDMLRAQGDINVRFFDEVLPESKTLVGQSLVPESVHACTILCGESPLDWRGQE